jgi:flagellar biosynthesis protein
MKEKKGIAVGYSANEPAPEILAIAKGFLAERMLEIAKENDITIYKDSDLAEVLSYMVPGNYIPESLYRVLSEILAYCYEVNEKFRDKMLKSGI